MRDALFVYARASSPTCAVERRREEHRLPVARQAAHDPVDLGLKAHVEHPVGLVEDERADVRKIDEAPLREILEPAGGRDEDVRLVRAASPARAAGRRRTRRRP